MNDVQTTTVLGHRAITADDNPGWADVSPDPGLFAIRNPKIGTLAYGMSAGGWDQPFFHEIGGGGVTIVPFAWVDGDLHVVLLKENRGNLGKKEDFDDINVIGGFFDEEGEPTYKAAVRELLEEAGLYLKLTEAGGHLYAANRGFNVLADESEGTHTFYAQVDADTAKSVKDNPVLVTLPVLEAILVTRDGITRAALATLIAELNKPAKG